MASDVTEDIQNFLVNFHTETPYGYSQELYAGEHAGEYSNEYYTEDGYAESEYTAGPQYTTAPTVTSEATTMQSTAPRSCFSGSCVSRSSTHVTTPDHVVVAPPSVVGLHYTFPDQGAGGSLAPNQVLWCEHSRLLNCPAVFRLDQEHEWIQHHLEHFGGNLPQNVICWFCDTIAFSPERPQDAYSNFMDRMQHIRHHILGDHRYTSEFMRVDFHVVKHLNALGVLSPEVYQNAMSFDETPDRFRLPSERSGSSSSSSSHQPSGQRMRGYAHDLDKEKRLERARRKEAKAARTR